MADERPLSRFAQRFVARKLEQLEKQASKGTGLYYELFAQNFTDSVDRLLERTKRPDLREAILSEAEKSGNYAREEKSKGRWDYDQEQGELIWKGEPLEWMKQSGKNDLASQQSPAHKYAVSSESTKTERLAQKRSR